MSDVVSMLRRKSSFGCPERPSSVKTQDSTKSTTSTTSTTEMEAHTSTDGSYGTDNEADTSISNSDDSDDDDEDDPLKALTGSLSGSSIKRSISALSAKNSALFEDSKLGFKRLKLPPVVTAPFLKKNVGTTLKKSAELQQLHSRDEEEAIKSLKEQKTPKDQILEKLDKKAAKDTEYVDYLALHMEDLQLNDFYFIKQAPYIKPTKVRDPIELYTIPGLIRHEEQKHTFDIFNELENEVILEEISQMDDDISITLEDIKRHMINLGANRNIIDDKNEISAFKITEDDLEMDSMKQTQDIQLIITKFHYLVAQVLHSDYSADKFNLIIEFFGLVMMDKRVFNSGNCILFSELIKLLIKWKYDGTNEIELGSIVQSWYSSTDQLHLLRRIVETLVSDISIIISQLRRLLSLHVFLQGQSTSLHFIEDPVKFDSQVNQQLYQKLLQWNNHSKDFFSIGEFSNTKIEFQCLFQCLKLSADSYSELDHIRSEVEKLRTKVSTSFHNSEQASFKSLLLLISTVLEADQMLQHHEQSII